MNLAFFQPGFADQLIHDTDDHFFHILRRIAGLFCLLFNSAHNVFLAVKHSAQHLGAPDIKTNIILLCHRKTLLIFRFILVTFYHALCKNAIPNCRICPSSGF